MAELKTKDFGVGKIANSGDYTGQTRDQIFLSKIKDGDPFIIGTTATGTKVIGISYSVSGAKRMFTYKVKKTDKKEITVPFSKVFKDPNFGGGKGSGGGAEETKVVESMQCFVNSYVFNTTGSVRRGPSLEKKPPNNKELEATAKYCRTTHSLKHCLEKTPEDWFDKKVFCKTANKLYAVWGSKFKGKVMFHRAGSGTGTGSAFMDNIYKAKSNCLKEDKASDIQQAPGSFSHDKWNPGDIWMTTLAETATPLLDKKFTESWGALNAEVERLADAGKVLGVSLKKLNSANIKEFNRTGVYKAKQRFLQYRFGTGDFFKSKDVYLKASSGEMQLRTFGDPWQGQITGTSAAGGKLGGGNIDYYLNQVFGKNIYESGGENAMKAKTARYDDAFKDEFWKLYHLFVFGTTPVGVTPQLTASTQSKSFPQNPTEKEEFLIELNAKDNNWIYSKYMCLKTIEVLLSGSDTKKNEFMTLAWLYAASNTDQSSFFIKIAD